MSRPFAVSVLAIAQLVDLDELGSNPEASDVVCATVEVDGDEPLLADEMAEGRYRAEGPVQVEIGYTEDSCDNTDEPDEVEEREGSVDLVIATDGTAKGSVLINGGELTFTAR